MCAARLGSNSNCGILNSSISNSTKLNYSCTGVKVGQVGQQVIMEDSRGKREVRLMKNR